MFQKLNKHLVLVLLTLIGAILHFYNLNWGSPFYFHPDERNIASSISQLEFPNHMNPNFFAYGSLPIYIIYFTGLLVNFFSGLLQTTNYELRTNFEQAILISRFYSAIFATLLIPIVFLIGKKLKDEKVGLLASFLTATSVGFIQFSHFGTFEMWLTFFSVLLFWVCLQKVNYKNVLLMAVIFGVLISIKVSSIVVLPLPILAILFHKNKSVRHIGKIKLFEHLKMKTLMILNIFTIIKKTIVLILVSSVIYLITNPFVFLDYQSFRGSMNYESSVVLGTLPVFYTGEFFNTIPVVFQFLHIYPFLVNPLITIIFVPAFIYLCWQSVKTKNQLHIMLCVFYVILFFPQAFLFAKWTRYMVPTLPFIYLITVIAYYDFLKNKNKQLINVVATAVIIINSIFAFSYFITAFVKSDTRVSAKNFAVKNIPSNAQIVSEVYDMGIVPFNSNFANIALFNFYDLDQISPEWTEEKLDIQLGTTDYIIIPSQRLLKTRLVKMDKFPKGNSFYKKLLNGELPYIKIYETPCDAFCKIIYLGDSIFSFEQTANVFDRPEVLIFKKI